jgi:surface antigen
VPAHAQARGTMDSWQEYPPNNKRRPQVPPSNSHREIRMKSRLLIVLSAALVAGTLAGCQAAPTQEQTGAVVGGVLGGVLGAQVGKGKGRTAAIIGGTLAGAYIGGAVGKNMDDTDRLKARQALEHNRTNQPASWTNPDSGASYTVTPTRTYETPSTGTVCREYTTEAMIGGQREVIYGTACRQPDGSWQAAN